jgi:tRNA pseudouridine38-40 synthase
MPRYRVILEYDGTPFVGWQVQAEGASVQGRLAEAVRRFSGETVSPRGAGRTDAGVHALAQVAHFDLAREWPPDTVRAAVNFHLRPDPVAILDCAVVPESFDARFSAVARHYRYRILARKAPPALDRGRVWWVPQPLSATAMGEAALRLVGRHDFTTFRAAACQARSPVKTLDRLAVTAAGDEILIEASARSFLHNQVRSMAGSLKLVGEGKWSAGDLEAALAARDRAACGPVAPAHGLYLAKVDYASLAPGIQSGGCHA